MLDMHFYFFVVPCRTLFTYRIIVENSRIPSYLANSNVAISNYNKICSCQIISI